MATQGFGFPPYIQQNNVGSNYSLNGELPPEIAVKEQALNRKQQIANLLLQQGLKPMSSGGMAGRFYVPPSWAQGLEKLANVGAGVYGNYQVGQGQQALAQENQRYTTDAIQQWQKDRAGTQEQPGPPVTAYPQGPKAPEMASMLALRSAGDAGTSGKLPDMSAPVKIGGDPLDPVQVPGPNIPAQPATPEQRQAADMALLSKRIPGAQAMLQMQQAHEDREQQRMQHDKEFDQGTAIRRDELKAKHEEVRLLREQRDNEFQGRMDDRQATRDQRDREIAEKLADARTTQQERDKLERDRMKMQDEQKKDQMKMEERWRERDDRTRREMNASNNETRLQLNSNKGDGVKLKPGERFKADGSGNVEAIPGSDLFRGQSDKHAKDRGAYNTAQTKTDMAISKIDQILDEKNKDAFNNNFGGYNAKYGSQYLPGKTQDIKKVIDSFKSDMRTAGLEIIRAGGSIGQMTEKEWPIVEQMIASIDPLMGEPAAREAFARVKAYMQRIQRNAKEMYDTEWGGSQFYKGGQVASSPSPSGGGNVLRFDAQGNQIQ